MIVNLKKKIYFLLDSTRGESAGEKFINSFIIFLILLNVCAVIFETVASIYQPYKTLFDGFEIFSIVVFTIEYILRIWTCTVNEKYKDPLTGRLKYIFSIGALIDLFAILPFFLPLLLSIDLRFIRILRLMRFFRFFKLGRYMNASKVIGRVFKDKKEELVISLIITFSLIIVASAIMYYAEHEAQPEKFSSIPGTMWWSVATLTTVGYGDMYPITGLGKTLTAFISILGIGMFALPAGILASGFSGEFRKSKKEGNHCPHCGKEIHKHHIFP